MNTKPITVVCGFPRCGSSLTMRMLHAGGMPVFADDLVSFETQAMLKLPEDHAWLDECAGKAVKILDPHEFSPPSGRHYRFIWLSRNPMEQAKSTAKFLRLVGVKMDHRPLAAHLEESYQKVPNQFRSYPQSSFHELSFETLVSSPAESARKLSELCEGLNVEPMVKCVVPRTPECLPHLLELTQV